jgi:hypothetical protein
MDESIRKLIDDGRWQPIEGAPKDENGYIILQDLTPDHAGRVSLPFFGRWSTKVSRFVAGGSAKGIPTHFRPLPDDRLSNALEVAVAALNYEEVDLEDPPEYKDLLRFYVQSHETYQKIKTIAEGGI